MKTPHNQPPTDSRARQLQNPRAGAWALLLVIGLALITLFSRFCFKDRFLAFYQDDFFYYLQIARNLATRGISSFDGIHLTNGYHPLWLALLAVLYKLFPGKSFFYALETIAATSVIVSYIFAKRGLLRYGVSSEIAVFCSLVIACQTLVVVRGGMEVTLTLPLIFIFLDYRLNPYFSWAPKKILAAGFLASLVILSRLDSGILIALVFLLDGIDHKFSIREWLVRSTLFASGACAVLGYVVFSEYLFGTAMPISGTAKELRAHHTISAAPFRFLFSPFALGKAFIVLPAVFCIFLIILLVNLPHKSSTQRASNRSILTALLLFPLLHLTILAFVSDWPLWPWYLYSLVSLPFAMGMAFRGIITPGHMIPRTATIASCAFAFLAVCYAVLFISTWSRRGNNDMYLAAQDIHAFSIRHPGYYAMGDRAGLPGFLLPDPILQLEGLVMDKEYLWNIRRQVALLDVLKHYGVRYYVATDLSKDGDCWVAVEPRQAGPDSRRMIGHICKSPVAEFTHGSDKTLIFDLQELPGK